MDTLTTILLAYIFLVYSATLPPPEIPFEPGRSHCVSKLSPSERRQALAWKHWKNPPQDAKYDPDPDHLPAKGESYIQGKPGRVYCPRGWMLSWDLLGVGHGPGYADAAWVAHCYREDGAI
jgi:hypothetical protein